MLIIFIIIGVLLVGGMVYYLKRLRSEKQSDGSYLDKMAYFFEGQVVVIPEHDHSRRVDFRYRGYECFYEDMEIPGLQRGTMLHVAYLKVKADSKLSVTFTERAKTQIRSNAQSLEDVTHSRWGNTQALVELPKSLEEFEAHTNDPKLAQKFINHEKALRAIETYKTRDSRGHPLLSLRVIDGVVALEFHAAGGLRPLIMELQHNVTAAEGYLQELILVAEILQTLGGEKSQT